MELNHAGRVADPAMSGFPPVAARMPLDLIDASDISAGCYEAAEWMVRPGEVERGVLAPFAARYRPFGKPVCVAGRIPTAEAAERILMSGAADLVAVGRAQHAAQFRKQL